MTETNAHGTAEAATKTHQYDARYRRIRTIDLLNRETILTYDSDGNLRYLISFP